MKIFELDEGTWQEWVATRPPEIQALCARLRPDRLYLLKTTGQRVAIHSFSEGGTVTVDVLGDFNLVDFETQVFGCNPDDLEECNLPAPNELVGVLLTEEPAEPCSPMMTTDELNEQSISVLLERPAMNAYEFTETMNEISGFGGSYERGCRCAVIAGAEWCRDHPKADLQIEVFNNVFGYARAVSEDAQALKKAIDEAEFTMDDGRKVQLGDELTTAMSHATINHVLYIAKHGWDAYVEKMSAPFKLEDGENDAA